MATVDRRLLLSKRDRIGALGYEFAPLARLALSPPP